MGAAKGLIVVHFNERAPFGIIVVLVMFVVWVTPYEGQKEFFWG